MKRNNKAEAIKDWGGKRVLIDTIAAYQDNGSTDIKVHLRSGETLNLVYEYNSVKRKVLRRLDNFLDFGEEKE